MEGSGRVLKFGGTSVGSGECIRRVASVIRHYVRDGEGMFPEIEASALSGVTDQLVCIGRFARTGDHESWQQELEAPRRKPMEAADKLFQPRIILAVLRQALAAFRQQPTRTAARKRRKRAGLQQL
jgi:aspartokinase